MELPMTFADFALTEGRFRKHFRKVPRDAWNDNMVMLTDFLELSAEEREGKFPYIWAVDRKDRLNRVLVAEKIVESCEERRDFWILLRDLGGWAPKEEQKEDIEGKIRAEVVGKIAQGLMQLAGDGGNGLVDLAMPDVTTAVAEEAPVAANGNGDYIAPWLETEECTSCDECIKLNNNIFAYNDDNKAYIKDPNAGPYTDLVPATEKCTAGVIHPGLPKDKSGKDIDKWIARGEKFN